MTALAQIAGIDARVHQDRRPLLGFGTFFRKELSEWVRGRRAIVIGLAATAFATLGALSAWMQANFGELELTVGDRAQDAARTYSTDPTVTTMAIFGTPIISVMAIFAGMSLLAAERESGTLAWSLTKPLSRTAILLAKWLAAVIAFGLAAVIIPIAASAAASTMAYGTSPDLAFVARAAGLYLAVPALYIGFALFTGAVVSSQAGVGALGMVLLLSPALAGSVLPAQLVDALPVGIGQWAIGLAAGEPVPLSTLLGWIVSMTIFLVGGIALFRRQEF